MCPLSSEGPRKGTSPDCPIGFLVVYMSVNVNDTCVNVNHGCPGLDEDHIMARPNTDDAFVFLGVRVPQDCMKRLKQLEATTGNTIAVQVRRALDAYLNQTLIRPTDVSVTPAVQKITRQVSALMKDLSQPSAPRADARNSPPSPRIPILKQDRRYW